MGYEIRIERLGDDGEPTGENITLEQWNAVISEFEGLSAGESAISATNPGTGEVVSIGGLQGVAEMMIGQESIPVFRWSRGTISLSPPASFDQANDPVRQMAIKIAAALAARVVGEEGEFYE